MSVRSKEHYDSLVIALENGLDLIDTSANYTNGESEKLIGKVLKENSLYRPVLITKGGYIQGDNLKLMAALNADGLAKDDIVKISDELWHSIHPEFLQSQIDLSRERLQGAKINYYLLHNPEYYFMQESASLSEEEFYLRLKRAFIFLEEKVRTNEIGAYGISSNGFSLSPEEETYVSLQRIIEIARDIKAQYFKMIQFPFNLIEIGALERFHDLSSVIELAKEQGLITVSNRPLNAFKDDKLIRLANYDCFYDLPTQDEVGNLVHYCLEIVQKKLSEQNEDESVYDIPLIKQFIKLWPDLQSPDAVEQVYFRHLFPLIARVWGGEGLDANESAPFFKLFEMNEKLSRRNMNSIAEEFRTQAVKMGLLPDSPKDSLTKLAIDFYLQSGVDHVLVGMKRPSYVMQLKDYFNGTI